MGGGARPMIATIAISVSVTQYQYYSKWIYSLELSKGDLIRATVLLISTITLP